MLCPEGTFVESDTQENAEVEKHRQKSKKGPAEGSGILEFSSFRNPKTWKKSISNFFRNQLRSTRSNDGDRPSGSEEKFEEKELSPEQKWQSLGKIFRRQSFAEQCYKLPNQQGESSSQSKRLAVRKVISSYFGRNQNSLTDSDLKK